MVDLKKCIVGRYTKSVPMVEFDSTDFKLAMINLFDTNIYINEYLGLILLKLGYDAEDKVLLCNYDSKNCSFDCILNGIDIARIKLINIGLNDENIEIILSKFNTEFGYECIPSQQNETGMKISLSRYSVKYPEGRKYTRCLSLDSAKFIIEFGEYKLELKLDKPKDVQLPLFDERGNYTKYKLESEEEIFNYFGNLTFPISIVDVYKEISSKFLGDVSKYPKFSLKLSKIDKDGEYKITDFIDLSYGNFEKIGMTTSEGYIICLDKDDNWRVELPSCKTNPSHFTMISDNGKIACTFNFDDNR